MRSLLKHPSAWLPIAMSFAALSVLLGYVVIFGVVHNEDEGTAAHLFQILMGGQVLVIAFFASTWFPRMSKETLKILALQIAAAAIPMATLFFFEM